MSNNNNAEIKKMSLEEFLGDDSLGESVWNEDDINLDAISNTTSLDLLKSKTQRHENDPHHPFGGFQQHAFHGSDHPSFANKGPPYIVKFSQLPPRFSDADIHELFHEKYTKFVKFKLFWELNKNPSIATLKEGSVFDQNFKRTGKVGFVELYSGRDMDKVLKYWTTPLSTIHNIKLEPAEFDDFKEYRLKGELLTDPKDNAGKPYFTPKRKSNPFGSAKPVDTQSKILEIEDKVGKLHIEDTKTLRRLSAGDQGPVLQPGKVTLLKKTPEEQEKKKPLSYLEVVKKSAEDGKKSAGSSSNATPSPNLNRATLVTEAVDTSAAPALTGNNEVTDRDDENLKVSQPYSADEESPGHHSYDRSGRGGRGGGYGRGQNSGNFRGTRGGRGGREGRGGFRHQNRDYNENDNFRKSNRQNSSQDSKNQHSGGNFQEEKRYSLFKPASGFLHESGNDSPNYKHNYRGNSNNHRGHNNHRGRFTPA